MESKSKKAIIKFKYLIKEKYLNMGEKVFFILNASALLKREKGSVLFDSFTDPLKP